MRKKLTNILLLSALLVAGMSTVVSCKDYDSDALADVKGQVGDLNSLIKTQVDAINSTTDELQEAIDDLTDLVESQGVSDLADRVSALETLTSDYATVKGTAETALSTANTAAQDASDALAQIESLQAQLNSINSCTCEDLEEAIAQVLSTQYSSLSSLNENASAILAAVEQISNFTNLLEGYVTDEELASEISTINTSISNATQNLQDQINTINTELSSVSATATTALQLAQQDSIRLDGIDGDLEELALQISNFNSITAQNTSDIDSLGKVVQGILDSAYATRAYVDSCIDAAIDIAVSDAVSQAKTYVQTYVSNQLSKYLTATQIQETYATINTVETLQSALEAADAALNERIDSLADVVKELESEFNLLNNKYASLITSINIDQISNPVFGTLNLPFGIKSTILCSFYGTTSNTGEFPTVNEDDYVFPDEAAGWEIVDGAEITNVIADMEYGTITDGNAGTVLLTINPGDVDADGINVRLASRSDDTTPAAYGDYFTLKKSSESVTTRSVDASTNGAYESSITTSTDHADLVASQLDIDEHELLSAAKQVFTKIVSTISTTQTSSQIDVLDVAQTVYSNFKSAIPEYYAIKCEWNDGEKERSVRSDYEIAALTMKPLSFATAKNGNGYSLPSLPVISELGLDIIEINYEGISTDKIKDVELFTANFEDVKFDIDENGDTIGGRLTIVSDADTESGDVEYTTISFDDYLYVYDEDGNITGITITVSLDELRNVVADFNETMDDMMDDVNQQLQDFVANINDTYISKVNNYLNKISNLLDSLQTFINNPNKYLQPTLFYNCNGSYGRLSREKSVPSVFTVPSGSTSGSITLYPTTFNAELLCPAYKKWVQVTKLSDEGSVSITNGNGSQQGIMLSSKEHGIVLNAEQGTEVEIVYSAIDYYGKVVTRKYYVTIK